MRTLPIYSVLKLLRYQNVSSPTTTELAIRQRFIARYPSQEANILAYQENSACRCVNDIMDVLKNDSEGPSVAASQIFNEEITVVIPKSIVGTTVVIDNTPTAYNDLISGTKQRQEQYKGLSPVILPDGKLQILFW
jgi:hypothetical protein